MLDNVIIKGPIFMLHVFDEYFLLNLKKKEKSLCLFGVGTVRLASHNFLEESVKRQNTIDCALSQIFLVLWTLKNILTMAKFDSLST